MGLESRLFHPQADVWNDHFGWSVSGTINAGLTDVGVVTIDCLQMNRTQLVEVRALWILVGKHPPC